jgi:hypothetical protein
MGNLCEIMWETLMKYRGNYASHDTPGESLEVHFAYTVRGFLS